MIRNSNKNKFLYTYVYGEKNEKTNKMRLISKMHQSHYMLNYLELNTYQKIF